MIPRQPSVQKDFSAEEFLPYREGLRSERASQVISALIKQEQVLIMSCFLPPLVGLRVDDVRGMNTRGWLDIILGFGWRPNLGIFINDVVIRELSFGIILIPKLFCPSSKINISIQSFFLTDFNILLK